ncbi:MAG: hypothetical protein ACT4P4_13225 [Betaproteobacteria bacterium]
MVAVLALIAFVVVAFVLPQREGSKAREAAQALVAGADAVRQQVAGAAEKSGKLDGAGNGVKVAPKTDPTHGELKWIVGQNGVIRGWNERNAIEVALTPSMQGGKLAWSCKGYPSSAMPATCGGR